jgi:Major Facilitator Superfamily
VQSSPRFVVVIGVNDLQPELHDEPKAPPVWSAQGPAGSPATAMPGEMGASAVASPVVVVKAPGNRAKRLPRQVRTLLAGTLITRASAFGYPFLSYRLTRDLGLPASSVSFVLAVFGGGWLLGQLAAGWMCDRFGPRTTLVSGMAISTVAVAVLGTIHSIGLLVLAAALAGAVYDIPRPVVGAVVANMLTDDGIRARITGWRHFATNVGAAVTGAAGGLLCDRVGITALFVVNAGGCAVFALMTFRALPAGALPNTLRGPDGLHSRCLNACPGPLADPRLWLACCAALGGLTCIVGLLSAVPLLMSNIGLSAAAYGVIQVCNAGTVIILTPVLNPWLSRHAAATRHPLTGLLAAGSAALGLALGASALAHSTLTMALAVTAGIPGEIILMVSFGDILHRIAPPTQQGRYQAAGGVTLALASIAAPVLTGQALLHGGASAAAAGFLAAGLFGSVCCFPLSNAIHQRQAAHRRSHHYLFHRSHDTLDAPPALRGGYTRRQ